MKVTLLAANAMAALPKDCRPTKVESWTYMLTPRRVMVLPGSPTFLMYVTPATHAHAWFKYHVST